MYCSTPASSVLHCLSSLFKLTSIESMMLSSHLILCLCLLICIQSFPTSGSFPMSCLFSSSGPSIRASNEYSWLISFRMDWSDLHAVQVTLMSLLQHHSSKASIFQQSAFFVYQLSHPYMTIGKTTALTLQTVVSKVMSLLSNTLSRFAKDFLLRSKCLWISWLKSPSTVILELKKIKSVPVSTFPPSLCHGVMGADAMILVFWI